MSVHSLAFGILVGTWGYYFAKGSRYEDLNFSAGATLASMIFVIVDYVL